MSAGVRVYALLLRLLPRHLREDGEDMLLTFRDRHADAAARGRTFGFVLRELFVVVQVAVTERRAMRAASARTRHEPRVVESLGLEVQQALRRLLRAPGFTAAAVATLSVAVAANVTIFTLVQRVVLAPLPFPTPERLVQLEHAAPGAGIDVMPGISTGLYREYAGVPALESVGAWAASDATVDTGNGPERARAVAMSESMGGLLGARPLYGRWFAADDGSEQGRAVAILTWDFWASRYGADPGVIGRTVRVDGGVHEIIGVMPQDFAFPDRRPALLTAMFLDPANASTGGFNMMALARLREGSTLDALASQLNDVVQTLPRRFPEHAPIISRMLEEAGLVAVPVLYRDRVVGGVRNTLWVLFGAVTVLLLIAVSNLANLFLVRAESRQREVAMRRALGAGSARIAGHHLAETMLVCGAAGVLGLVLAGFALRYVVAASAAPLPRLHEVRLGSASVLYSLVLVTVSGAGFALMQMLRRTQALYSSLQDAARATASRARMRGRHGLVVAQVSLAVMLLVAAGLMIESFQRLRQVDPGFAPGDALVFTITLPASDYPDREPAAAFHYDLLERLRALAGVREAGIVTTLPLRGDGWGDPLDVRGAEQQPMNVVVRSRRVTGSAFAALGVPLQRGRLLDDEDERARRNVAVINAALADAYFPGEDPIGRLVREIGDSDDQWFEVVGVVGNTVTHRLDEPAPLPKLYMPLMTAKLDDTPPIHTVSYVLRTDVPAMSLLPAVWASVRQLDPGLALARAETLDDMRVRAASGTAFSMLLLVIASLMALLLGIIGVYAVIAVTVAQRTKEIGVRIALGAAPEALARMILRQSALTIGIGVVLGLAGAAAAGRALQSLLYGVHARDPVTFGAVAGLLFVVGLAASWVPARRAARVSPLSSLQA